MTKEKKSKTSPPEIAARGGNARALALTSERKSEIAKKGALARWRDNPIKAERAGTLRLGTAEIPCANLPDGRRVLSEKAILSALGRDYSGYYSKRDAEAGATADGRAVHRSVEPTALRNFIPPALAEMLAQPIAYFSPGSGSVSKGVPAEALPMILKVWIGARDAGALKQGKLYATADKAEILYDGFANVGIAALIDEATGALLDNVRAKYARLLESYVTKELANWGNTFEDDFYKEMFRLRRWDVARFTQRPGVVGKWTTDIVYRRLAPGVLKRLQEVVPRDLITGRLKNRLFNGLKNPGYMALKTHLASVTTIMKMTNDGDWKGFQASLDRIHPRFDDQLLLPFITREAIAKDSESED